MIQGTQWPSFIIQGVILASNLWFLAESGSKSNLFIFLSLIAVFTLFSLQTTSTGFLYLYPVVGDKKAVGIDTWILRLLIMASLFFLFLGIVIEYSSAMQWWLFIVAGVSVIIIPIILNLGISDWMRNKAEKNRQ